jgi:hypothetical protein
MPIELPETPQIGLHVMQFPPTGLYEITNGDGTMVFRVLSLGAGQLDSNPPFDWKSHKEQWFSTKGQDLAALLAVGPLQLKLVHRSPNGGVDPTIQSAADALAKSSEFAFQIYSAGLLPKSDWIPGAPSTK